MKNFKEYVNQKAALAENEATLMSEDEINEFLGLFKKKPQPEPKGRLYRPGDAPIHAGKSHVGSKILKHQGGLDYDGIDPDTVPVFKGDSSYTGK